MAISRLGEYEAKPQKARPSLEPSLRDAATSALAAVGSATGLVEDTELAEIGRQLDSCRAVLAASMDAEAIESAARRSSDLTRQVIAHIGALRNAEKREIGAIVFTIQDAVSSLSGNSNSYYAGVKQSVDQFEKIASVGHLLELKSRLTAEVRVLKSKTAEGERAWQASVAELSRRIATLELQLQNSRQQGTLDPVTQVANRWAFDKRCEEWLKSGLLQFSLLMIDVDDFKKINDSHGHPEGDRALAAVAASLKKVVRSNQDLVARIGGDEFAVLALDLPLRAAESLFSRIFLNLKEASESAEAPLPAIALSCGVAEFTAGDTVKSLVQRADEALYEAKRRGKNRVVIKEKPLNRDL